MGHGAKAKNHKHCGSQSCQTNIGFNSSYTACIASTRSIR